MHLLGTLVEQFDEWRLPWYAQLVVWVALGVVLSLVSRYLIRKAHVFARVVRDKTPLVSPEDSRADQRLRTVRNVLTSTVLAVIWVIVFFGVAESLGIRLSGLVVWATVIGGAFAFGAQQIVRDLLAGFFMLIEDQYGVGDVVDLGHATGTVEEVTLRVTKLRDVEGRVWFVPNGQIVRVANLSHDYAQAVLDISVPLEADLDAVTAELESMGGRLRRDPQTAHLILGEPKVLGVQELRPDQAVLRFTVKTMPAAQFEVLRIMRAAVFEARRDGRLPAFDGTQTIFIANSSPQPADLTDPTDPTDGVESPQGGADGAART